MRAGPITSVEDLEQLAEQEQTRQAQMHERVCSSVWVRHASRARAARCWRRLTTAVKERGIDQQYLVMPGGCQGNCAQAPLVSVQPLDVLYHGVAPGDATAILESVESAPVERLRCDTGAPFFARQKRVVTEYRGLLNPERIEDYMAVGGYTRVVDALTQMTPEQVVQQVMHSGLRGRGGAGYPTGLKWSTVAKAPAPHKYVICNADEGDPGAFMNRSVLEDYPFRVLEGMTIAAYAVGADRAMSTCVPSIRWRSSACEAAIRQAQQARVARRQHRRHAVQLHVEVRLGAGAFVCGEETALIASIEGKRGHPVPPALPGGVRPVGHPTLINNVETYRTSCRSSAMGRTGSPPSARRRSKGTKTFALSGRVMNTGLVEVPLGTSLRR